jgi:hypothetical protein
VRKRDFCVTLDDRTQEKNRLCFLFPLNPLFSHNVLRTLPISTPPLSPAPTPHLPLLQALSLIINGRRACILPIRGSARLPPVLRRAQYPLPPTKLRSLLHHVQLFEAERPKAASRRPFRLSIRRTCSLYID